MAHRMLNGGIEGVDRRLFPKYLKRGDFVLQLGGGSGLTSMRLRRVVGPEGRVVVLEPDPAVHRMARENFERNGMADIVSHAAAGVASRDTKTVSFYRARNFWGSGLAPRTDGNAIEVPGIFPPDVVPAGFPGRKVLHCDVEGYETELLARDSVLRQFQLLIVEFHIGETPSAGPSPYVPMLNALERAGFVLIDIDEETFVYSSEKEHAVQGRRVDQRKPSPQA